MKSNLLFFLVLIFFTFSVKAQDLKKTAKEKFDKIEVKNKQLKLNEVSPPTTFNSIQDSLASTQASVVESYKTIEIIDINPTSLIESYPYLMIVTETGDTVINYQLLVPILLNEIKAQDERISKLEQELKIKTK